MATAVADGIATRYEVIGSGPPLLMYAPGGFDATVEKWSTLGVYARIKPLEHLSRKFTCIAFDRRECGHSGGRLERVTWGHYVAQGKGLLDHLGIKRAHLMGGCMGCSPVIAFAVAHPDAVLSMVLYWPVGGARYRINGQQRFAQHLSYVQGHGLAEVVALATTSGKSFGEDPRGGPWASVIRRDPSFAASYARQDVNAYRAVVDDMCRALLDRDTAPGAEPEDLLKLDIPGVNTNLPSGKFDAFKDLLTDIVEGGHKVLVFSQFVQMLHIIRSWLQIRDLPFAYLDGHAGVGLYDLAGEQAGKTGEWLQGIARLWGRDDLPALLDDYLASVAALNPEGGLRYYPGSPEIARRLTRAQDRVLLNEKHPQDGQLLKANMAGDRRVTVHLGEGWHLAKALLPVAEKRALLLIDPPFEQADELERCAESLATAIARMRNALTEIVVEGIKTNVPLHQEIFQHAAFRAGGTDIHYLERRLGLK